MANQWAIAIGINTYRAFQSLHYAQHDAEALCRHLIDSGITAPENCLLLTTASALHRGHSTFPERETIARWLKGLVTGGMGPEDSLILFFSGYGVHAGGEDYLMPVDGDPADAAATGIAVQSIYRLLAQVPSGRVLVALDMNRNAGSLGEPAGAFTARIAQQASQQYPGIATLLSCMPPEQFARESSGVRHGFFTAGILEVLRGRQREQPGELLDLQTFGQQLRDRMAELCEHYWRPVQTPVVIGQYSIPLGRTAVGAFVSSGGGNESEAPMSSGAQRSSSGAYGGAASGYPLNGSAASGSAANGSAANGSAASSSQTAILTPLDISRPADVSEGFGDDFASTWAWALKDEGRGGTAGQIGEDAGSGNGSSLGDRHNNSGVTDANNASSDGLDPYATAWEEDFGDTVPFDANSDVVLNAKAQLEQQAQAEQTDSAEPVQGRPGHGGDGTDWHWADLSVAAATENETNGNGYSPSFPEPGPYASADANGSNSDSLGGAAGLAGVGLAGAGLVIASRPGSDTDGSLGRDSGGYDSSSQATPLNPTQAMLEAEDPNWNWSGDETAIDVEAQGHADEQGHAKGGYGENLGYDDGLAYDDPSGYETSLGTLDLNDPDQAPLNGWQADDLNDRPVYDSQTESAAAYEDPIELDWPNDTLDNNALDWDDEPGGIPIVELDSEELLSSPQSQEPMEASGRSERLPAWLSPRVLGVLGLVSIVALGWMGFFRGERGSDALPKLQSKFNLPDGFALPDFRRDAGDSSERDGSGRDHSESRLNNAQSSRSDSSQLDPAAEASVGAATRESELGQAAEGDRAGGSSTGGSFTDRFSTDRSSTATPSRTQAESSGNSDLLSEAQRRIEAGQASSLNRAINAARRIPPDDPNYDQARRAMNQWSQEVLELSQQRAQEGKYLEAIATARLVPSDMDGFGEAQQSISQWQIPAQLEHAKAVIRPGQASSYNRAIGIARNVPAGAPTYSQAQTLMQGWGNEIFEIAQQRASREQWGLAVAAAKLVPPDMSAHGAAQSAIADWQPRLNQPK